MQNTQLQLSPEENDSLLTTTEESILHEEIIEMIMPLIKRLHNLGYIKKIKDKNDNYIEKAIEITYVFHVSLRLIKLYKQLNKTYYSIFNNKLLSFLNIKNSLNNEIEKHKFIDQLIAETKNCI